MEVLCPSGLKGTIRKPKVRDINELRKATGASGMVRAYSKLLDACWVETQDKGPYRWDGEQNRVPWDSVLSGDRFYLLLRVHDVLYGRKYEFSTTCRSCGQVYRWQIDTVEDVRLVALGEEAREVVSSGGVFKEQLDDGTVVEFLPGTGKLEQQVSEKDEAAVRFLLPRIRKLGDATVRTQISEAIMDMDADVFDQLQAVMQATECGPDPELWTKCSRCDAVGRTDLPFDRSFFFPRSTR